MVRQRNAARASLEQRDAEPVFKMPYLLPDRPMRDVQILRRFDKAAAPGRRLKGSDRIEGVAAHFRP
jgi:hypothetical protein